MTQVLCGFRIELSASCSFLMQRSPGGSSTFCCFPYLSCSCSSFELSRGISLSVAPSSSACRTETRRKSSCLRDVCLNSLARCLPSSCRGRSPRRSPKSHSRRSPQKKEEKESTEKPPKEAPKDEAPERRGDIKRKIREQGLRGIYGTSLQSTVLDSYIHTRGRSGSSRCRPCTHLCSNGVLGHCGVPRMQ